ncbi:hypothetical protein NEOLEDRAFT_1129554 [Neolentinus lepideus HHB14362 ss-1]|uniref:Yeast cell wall synthesis Kre9/Knh1-like N-terminal domain-containing protein n=1 Tax=Neolentinus lepideus HHB14362 ss-1 TaxID=1314782 RepID=A0A165UIN0_9AGAM|nr:hypothetical protein NEOLEDRAFT_1129554 [Neolentinus lepideus HHB14362 ss-1]
MFGSAFTAVVFAALAPSALATIFTTSPVASTSWPAGQQATISWQDDGISPSLQSFGPSKVSIYVGNAIQQTLLQPITPSVDVSTTSSIVFTPDASIGPNGADYFIRFESLSLKDATNPQYPALAFSAKFALSGMSGTFNSTVQAEIAGSSTAPLATPSATAATSSVAKTSAVSSTSKASASATSTAKSASASSGASQQIASTGLAAIAGVAAAVFGFTLW